MSKPHIIKHQDLDNVTITSLLAGDSKSGKRLTYLASVSTGFIPQFVVSKPGMEDFLTLALSHAIQEYNAR